MIRVVEFAGGHKLRVPEQDSQDDWGCPVTWRIILSNERDLRLLAMGDTRIERSSEEKS